jgi:hypothetical protein
LHHVIIAVEKATGPPPLGATGKMYIMYVKCYEDKFCVQ